MASIVPPKPTCRRCGAVVKPGRRCPSCGKRQWRFLLGWHPWVRY